VLGHNGHVAWGATNSFSEVQDAYLERFQVAEEARYLAPQGWRQATVLEERIRVKNRPDVLEPVCATEHGPVLLGDPRTASEAVIALRWTALEPGNTTIAALLAMNRAGSAIEFREALRCWSAPVLNFVFADDQNNIGYVMAGRIPRSRTERGIARVAVCDADYVWIDYIPFEELPQSWNPACGYVVSANQAVHSPDHCHHISWDFLGCSRADRVEQILGEDGKPFDVDDFASMQLDVFCAMGKRLAKQCVALAPSDPLVVEALAQLVAWDGHCRARQLGGGQGLQGSRHIGRQGTR
jgi:penicillin amidase